MGVSGSPPLVFEGLVRVIGGTPSRDRESYSLL